MSDTERKLESMKNSEQANNRKDKENKKSRIALYVFFDRDGIVEDYVVYQLQQLQTVTDKIVTICQGYVRDDNKERLEEVSNQVIYRDNKGYDAGAWKDAILNHVGWGEISKYDDLLLMNDSCFGPIYPFSEMFDDMDSKDLDFWGVTEHGKLKDAYGLTEDGIFHAHIQSYFICIDKKMHTSEVFREYWQSLKATNSFEESVTYFEVGFTHYFEKIGFSWDVYTDTKQYINDGLKNHNPTAFWMHKLLIEQRNPLIKKKSMMGLLPVHMNRNNGNVARKTFDYITENTQYDEEYIYRTILRLGKPRSIYELFHLDYFLPETKNAVAANSCKKKIALILHMDTNKFCEYCHDYLHFIPEYADLYITVTSNEQKEHLESLYSDIECNKLEIRQVEARGFYISSLLIGARDIFTSDYDYVGFIHDDISLDRTDIDSEEGYRENMFNCMLKTKDYIENIIAVFENNKHLGILAPPYPMSGKYIRNFGRTWADNYKPTKALSKRLNLRANIEENTFPITTGTTFWCRPQALKKLMEQDWSYDDFEGITDTKDGDFLHSVENILEYVAQDQQYCTGIIMPLSHAQLVYSVENYLFRRHKKAYEKYKKALDRKPHKFAKKIVAIRDKIRRGRKYKNKK